VKIAFAVTETGAEAAAGDFFTALELGEALHARYGWKISYLPKENWYDLDGFDILIVMVDEYEFPAIRHASPHLIKIAWARNWFERWVSCPWIDQYDLLLASSHRAVELFRQRTNKLAKLLRIATNPVRFNTNERPSRTEFDYVFTGHYWEAHRDIIDALNAIPHTFCGAIYGKHWEKVPELKHLHRGFVPYSRIHEIYRHAAIVIDDANHVTKEWGAANSRIFDALAAGCLVITNSQSVSDEVFSGRLPVYDRPATLGKLLEQYLTHDAQRIQLAAELRKEVLSKHCYTHRAQELGFYLQALGRPEINLTRATTSAKSFSLGSSAQASVNAPHKKGMISFIIPLFNHLAETREMLASLRASLPSELDYEIHLADDASTDETPSWLQTLQDPRITVHMNATNQGFAATVNAAALSARGEWLCILNNDLLFSPGWLEPMLAIINDPQCDAGIVGNVQYRVADGALDHAGVRLNLHGQFEHVREIPEGVDAAIVPWVTGACFLIQRGLFVSLGGFDTRYRNGCEDLDLCFKVRSAGKKVWIAYNSRIRHHVSLSRGGPSQQDERNSQLLFERWRAEIKHALAKEWISVLQTRADLSSVVDGELATELLQTPHVAGRILAEAQLAVQERRWQEMFAQEHTAHDVSQSRVCIRWVSPSFQGKGVRLCLAVQGVRGLEMLHVCGSIAGQLAVGTLEVTVEVNALHRKRFSLLPGRSFHLPLARPLFVPLTVNMVEITVEVEDGSGSVDAEAIYAACTFSHVGLDERMFDLRGCLEPWARNYPWGR
jgi:GT2 family glycosyltransferase